MTERNKDLLLLAALLALMVLLFAKILFTGQIVRAPDIINEFYWGVKDTPHKSLGEVLSVDISRADWNPYINSGHTNEGGMASLRFLVYQPLLFHLIPAPASVAWFMVLHLFLGGAGLYLYCRAVGCGRFAALLGGLVFALAPENASLINAGHVMKIATISYAPWAFYFFERGFQSRRLIFFLTTGLVLAFQFFNTHWQVAFYTCLAMGAYGILRLVGVWWTERHGGAKGIARLVGLNAVMLFFFLSAVSISLLPLANWSVDSTRGVASGDAGKGGLQREEAMLWSLPPEEVAAFVIPGFFGLSRQEAGDNPTSIDSYYWGRMVFTQTTSYMGLLPWLLAPLPLIFRRDRYTWLAVAAVVGGILFSMGKYTPFYNLLFDYFPGINRFRVPKMMMFVPVMGLGVLAARGIDILRDEESRRDRRFRWYLAGLVALPLTLLAFLGVAVAGKDRWIAFFHEILSQPTRYEQGGYLVQQRWDNLVRETALAAGLSALIAGSVVAFARRLVPARVLLGLLLLFFVADVWRINDKFLFLVPVPEKAKGRMTPAMEFVSRMPKEYRVLPMDGSDPMQYASHNIPVMFTPNPVQQQRWQNFLDAFSFAAAMPDMLNVRYLVYAREQYEQEKSLLGNRFVPVFTSPDGNQVVLENRTVLPKGWLVPAAAVIPDPRQALAILQNPSFDPRRLALVETPPPIPLSAPEAPAAGGVGAVRLERYEGSRIDMAVTAERNALLVLGEKYYRGWKAYVDGKETTVYPVNHTLRGIYLAPGSHRVEFLFDPFPFKVGKYLTLASFALFVVMLGREWWGRKGSRSEG